MTVSPGSISPSCTINVEWSSKLSEITILPSNIIFPTTIPSNTTMRSYRQLPASKKALLQPPVAVIILDSLVADMCIRDMKLNYHHPDEFENIACNLAQVPQMRLRDYMHSYITQLGFYNFPRRRKLFHIATKSYSVKLCKGFYNKSCRKVLWS